MKTSITIPFCPAAMPRGLERFVESMTLLRSREAFEAEEAERLAPFAVKSGASRGRLFPEDEHAYRTAFQRDRDRIVHSRAFRRLEYKTQVFVYHEGDHYRNRLTHTLEGGQISRTIARVLRLNEELAEAVVLAHDLGHTPFGHAGERVLDELMQGAGGFDHNRQSLRIVDWLEDRYPGFRGLNLSYESREGILKHGCRWEHPLLVPETTPQPSLEAQVADCADEIAYTNHDLDDGLRAGLLRREALDAVPLWRETADEVARRIGPVRERVLVAQIIVALGHCPPVAGKLCRTLQPTCPSAADHQPATGTWRPFAAGAGSPFSSVLRIMTAWCASVLPPACWSPA